MRTNAIWAGIFPYAREMQVRGGLNREKYGSKSGVLTTRMRSQTKQLLCPISGAGGAAFVSSGGGGGGPARRGGTGPAHTHSWKPV